MWFLRDWRRRRVLERATLDGAELDAAWRALPLLEGLGEPEAHRLRQLAELFIHEKSFEPVEGVTLDREALYIIALQACLPILNLDLDWYEGWKAVIVYPADFFPEREYEDESGLVHRTREHLAGESWERGPVILSLHDVLRAGEADGYNLILHEFAHKLDALDGVSNGKPPLHRDMAPKAWTDAFSAAFDDFQRRLQQGEETDIDPYAGESPAEFFAVLTETFFELPHALLHAYPAVYEQMCLFYRQDPAARRRSA